MINNQLKHKMVVFGYCLLVSNFASPIFAQVKDLTKLLPEDTNVIVLVNEAELFASELAKANDWNQKKESSYYTHKSVIPPDVDDYVLGSSVDFEFGHQNWEIALIKRSTPGKSPKTVADMLGGKVDKIAGKNAIVLPGDTFLVKFSEFIVGQIYPANRQFVSRWIKHSESDESSTLSPYLNKGIQFSQDPKNHMVIAFDLTDAFPEKFLKDRLRNALIPANDKMMNVMTHLKGVTIAIQVTDKINAKILVDFNSFAGPFKKHGKKLIVDVLGNYGMMIEGISRWTASTAGNRYELSGEISQTELRDIFRMAQPTGITANSYQGSTSGSDTTKQSIQYLKSMFILYHDIKSHKNGTIHLKDTWIKRNLDEIESLSVVGVDDEIVEFSEYLTSRYRDILGSIRQKETQTKYRKATSSGGYNYNYSGNRYYGYNGRRRSAGARQTHAGRRNRRAIENQEEAKAYQSVADVFKEIENSVSKFRNKMSKKYQVSF